MFFSAEGGIGPENYLDFEPAGWSEMAFKATHLGLCGKDKYFENINIKIKYKNFKNIK